MRCSGGRPGLSDLPGGAGPGGAAAAAAALIVAIPSFKTRGDYLAIISLAFLFIVKSFFENVQILGGAGGSPVSPTGRPCR